MLSIAKKQCVVKEICAKNTAKSKRGKGLAAFARKGDTKQKKGKYHFLSLWEEKCLKMEKREAVWEEKPFKNATFPKTERRGFFHREVCGACGKPCGNCVKLLL